MTQDLILQAGRRTVLMETEAVTKLEERINGDFKRACELILQCGGRTIVTGMGKSGHIGRKIAATLASTGTPSFFVHPGEASHGDLGMITRDDLVIAISNSGTSAEVLTLLPLLKRLGIPMISMTGKADSPLAQAADVNLDIAVETEACPLGLAPTSSTTVTLVMGDALAVALLEARGFSAEDFAFSHPGGALGRRLLLKVEDVMHSGDELPQVSPETLLPKALLEMTSKGFGMTTVVDHKGSLLGVFTDGDLRRVIDHKVELDKATMDQVMSRRPKTVSAETLAAEALRIMEDHKITALVVEGEEHQPVGVVHMHDILRAGVI
ncbi:KpsF/GutQ family sugar-phosphate isomerase [Microbulbifer thermotolerans]|uniref:Arabinose 5-phosphate isomerase n=1 Tax=Microbulbifer thermotolerans TaxID=252514 RepID=A0A143HL92_MICTH|nr:KpsF/GutQ family sugar-phosphate isomerase [Microbulbifer thermotolerans]AMX02032.1 D-arabinose 5-phosphate isomerase [Microbulbifer thermotolerans]MCX2780784.1 KpsF/GutQ family sugar-phosphate isomerase [Microbulbifer thermotolerans]MCX2783100.1 KpsF/GutQ family sugar-phosphate isomerase [Microbulbifer thermotolerans]MCX2794298.1 KpsF/GutQ family sugar-phosphate isomerase [Microbulbifer thermotolerans]MCX2800680.1 KpsF/GutQ family sugar-phosphate isomerase [Microbulbifer thermotolerans]